MTDRSTFFVTFQEAETESRPEDFVFKHPFGFLEGVARANALVVSRRTNYPHTAVK